MIDARKLAKECASDRAAWLAHQAPVKTVTTVFQTDPGRAFRESLELVLVDYAMRMGYIPAGPQDRPPSYGEAMP
jgi:hypothetical protein